MLHSARREGTALYNLCYNNRGLISHRFGGNKNLIRQADGTLWAVISRTRASSLLLRSTNNGFSWETVIETWDQEAPVCNTRVEADMLINGPINHIGIFPGFNKIAIFKAGKDDVGQYDIHHCVADLDADLTDIENWTLYKSTYIDNDEATKGVFTYVVTQRYGYMTYVDGSNNLAVREQDADTLESISGKVSESSKTWIPAMDSVVDEDSNLDIICVADVGSTDVLYHVRYTPADDFGSPVAIDTAPGTSQKIVDVALAKDGYGTLCAVWGETNSGDTDIDWRVAISTDNGTTWSKLDIAKVSGNTAFVDAVVNETSVRTDLIGSVTGGFMISYTMDNSSNVPKSYIRYLATTNGSSYILSVQDELDIYNDDQIVQGVKFFKPASANEMMDFGDLGLIRVATVLGEGDSELQNDETPVSFDQFLLREGPFPTVLTSETGSYTTDTPTDQDLLASVTILAGPSENIDFYTDGLIGSYTTRYMSAFDRIGTSTRVLKYEANGSALTGDRSAYGSATEYNTKTIWDPQSYGFPTPNLTTTEQDDFVEKDVRKVWFPPDFHLSRTFVRNNGNFLKRTVWLAWYDGNEYEISQVVPRFLNNQICYYEANAYVVGPSRDPFSRSILPSET